MLPPRRNLRKLNAQIRHAVQCPPLGVAATFRHRFDDRPISGLFFAEAPSDYVFHDRMAHHLPDPEAIAAPASRKPWCMGGVQGQSQADLSDRLKAVESALDLVPEPQAAA